MQERERAEKILKDENERERQKRAVKRTYRPKRGILFRRNENNNLCIRILQGRRLGP